MTLRQPMRKHWISIFVLFTKKKGLCGTSKTADINRFLLLISNVSISYCSFCYSSDSDRVLDNWKLVFWYSKDSRFRLGYFSLITCGNSLILGLTSDSELINQVVVWGLTPSSSGGCLVVSSKEYQRLVLFSYSIETENYLSYHLRN